MNRFYLPLLFIIFSYLFVVVVGEVTILRTTLTIYDKAPKLRICGAGFDADDHDIYLSLGASGQNLTKDRDYLLTKDPDGDSLILKLLSNRRWVDLTDRTPPVSLILDGVYFGADSTVNLLHDPVIIASVLATPSVYVNDTAVYEDTRNEITIAGEGWIGAKRVDLYFVPPLYKEVWYEDITRYPLQTSEVRLRLRHGYKWREEPGPLFVMGIDTGGGPVKPNGEDGVTVANIVDSRTPFTVFDTADSQLVYNNAPRINITGAGFGNFYPSLEFANGITDHVNYFVESFSDSTFVLQLLSGQVWLSDFITPSMLTLTSINNDRVTPNIAKIFEVPTVLSNNIHLYRTLSSELIIYGTGFPTFFSGYKPLLTFFPSLYENIDYTMRVVKQEEITLTLINGRAWRSEAGTLQLVSISTISNADSDQISFGDGITVAEIYEDIDPILTGGVVIYPMGVKVYQSALNERIQIAGSGFKENLEFTFEPNLRVNVDYQMEFVNSNSVNLNLVAGKMWRSEAGSLVVRSIKIDGSSYAIGGSEGIRVAVVIADPVINPGDVYLHESQSKLLTITGSGFADLGDMYIMLRPSYSGAYRIIQTTSDTITVRLLPDCSWLPSFMSFVDSDDDKHAPLQIGSIDTGAGAIYLEEPITVGYIYKDIPNVVCNDSCPTSFNGICDDSTLTSVSGYYYPNNNNDYYYYYYYNSHDCVGTDCTDCGGVSIIPIPELPYCTNTCLYPRDGVCDDSRGTKYCDLGTDCQDCGPVGADNFTRADDDGWWDDDDDYWTFNDNDFLDTPGEDLDNSQEATYEDKKGSTQGEYWIIWLGVGIFITTLMLAGIFLYKQKQTNVSVVIPYSMVEMKKYVALPQSESGINYL